MATLDLGKITGKSAYEIACDNGFEGSESQWLASLKGADGVVSSAEGINVVTDLSKTIPDDTSSLVNAAGAKAVNSAIDNFAKETNYVTETKYLSSGSALSSFTLDVDIKAGETFAYMVEGSGVTTTHLFRVHFADGTNTGWMQLGSVGTKIYKTYNKDVVKVHFYPSTGTTTAGDVKVSVFYEVRKNIDVLYSKFSGVYNEISSVQNASVGYSQSFTIGSSSFGKTIPCYMKKGETIGFRMNTDCFPLVGFYVWYDGATEHTALGFKSTNELHEFVLTDDIVKAEMYINGTYITQSGTATWYVYNSNQVQSIKNENAISELKDVIGTSEKSFSVRVGSATNTDSVKVQIHAKKDETIKFKLIDDDNCVSAIRAFYYIEEGKTDDEHVNMGISGATPNTLYSFVAPKNIDYITMYLDNTNVVKAGSVTLYAENTNGLKPKVDSIASGSGSGSSSLNIVKEQEKNDTLKRFLPHAIMTNTKGMQSYGSKAWEKCCNILHFTDSHIDDAFCSALNKENVTDIVNFVNNAKFKAYDRPDTTDEYIFDAVVNCGDAISSSYDISNDSSLDNAISAKQQTDVSNAQPFFDITENLKVPFIYTLGNHDMMIGDRLAELYGDWAEQKFGLVRQTKSNGNKSTWSYYDIESKKIRVIAVDVHDVPRNEGKKTRHKTLSDGTIVETTTHPLYCGDSAWYISQEQMTWLINVALNFDSKTDKGWGVVILSHQSIRLVPIYYWNDDAHKTDDTYMTNQTWYSWSSQFDILPQNDRFEGDIEKFYNVLKAFNTQGTYTNSYTKASGSFFNININADFTRYNYGKDANGNDKPRPHVVCWLNGHEHVDADNSEQVTDSTGMPNFVVLPKTEGINMIWALQSACMTAYGTPKVVRYEGTSTQNAFDCISIDTIHRKIRIVRYGAGVDCYGKGGDRWLEDGLSY